MEALLIIGAKALIPLLVTWAFARADQWAKTKIENERHEALVLKVGDAAETAILAVSQTYVDGLASAAKDGKITAPEAAEAKKRALDEAMKQLGPDAWAKLCKTLGGEEAAKEALSGKLEATLRKLKGFGLKKVLK